jgi:hypothetical protein
LLSFNSSAACFLLSFNSLTSLLVNAFASTFLPPLGQFVATMLLLEANEVAGAMAKKPTANKLKNSFFILF